MQKIVSIWFSAQNEANWQVALVIKRKGMYAIEEVMVEEIVVHAKAISAFENEVLLCIGLRDKDLKCKLKYWGQGIANNTKLSKADW